MVAIWLVRGRFRFGFGSSGIEVKVGGLRFLGCGCWFGGSEELPSGAREDVGLSLSCRGRFRVKCLSTSRGTTSLSLTCLEFEPDSSPSFPSAYGGGGAASTSAVVADGTAITSDARP